MKRMALLSLALLSAAVVLLRSGPDAPSTRPAGEAASTSSGQAGPEPLRQARPEPLRQAQGKMAGYRVRETIRDGAVDVQGSNYTATVDEKGLKFGKGDTFVRLRAAALEQGSARIDSHGARVARPAFARATVARDGVTEEYVFENKRAEQLFHIEKPVAQSGDLRVRVDVESTFPGKPAEIYKHSEGWREPILANGGIVFGEGRDRLAYHSAVAIDALGRRQTLHPRLERGQIVLDVPEAFAVGAAYPIVVDPFLELDFSASGGGISLTAEVSDAPAMLIDGGGNPIIAWSDDSSGNFEIYVRRFNGLEWVEMGTGSDKGGGISNNAGRSTNPSIAADNTGNTVALAWQDDTSGNFEIYCKKFTILSGVWAAVGGSAGGGGVSANIGESLYPSVALTGARVATTNALTSEPIVAWQDTSSGTSEIHVAWFHPGDPGDFLFGYPPVVSGWYGLGTSGSGDFTTGVVATTTAFGVSERPRLLMDSQNRATLVWQDTVSTTSFEILAARYSGTTDQGPSPGSPQAPTNLFPPTAGAWTNLAAGAGQTNVSATAAGLSINPNVAISSTNVLQVVWQEFVGATYEVYMAQVSAAGAVTGLSGSNATTGITGGKAGNSVFPSVGVSGGGLPTVAWQDDSGGNPEICVLRHTGAAWVEVGIAGSAGAAGISNTPSLSLTPTVAVDSFGDPVVAWMDGADGKFEVYVKRFFSNAPIALRQRRLTGLTIIPAGGFTTETTVVLQADVMSELAANVRLQVEVRPIDTPFTGAFTAEGGLVAAPASFVAPGSASINFSGLANIRYHWRARTIDIVGRTSAWVSFGGNLDGVMDFEVQVPLPIIATPTGLNQLVLSTGLPLAEGGSTTDSSVILTGVITSPTGGQVILDVERILVGAGGPAGFSQIPTISSGPLASGSTATVTLPSMANGSYRWAAQTREVVSGRGSGWVEFGAANNVDFIIGVPAATPSVPANLAQLLMDGVTPLPLTGTTPDLTVVFQANVVQVGSDTISLEVEVTDLSNGSLISGSSPTGVTGLHTVTLTFQPGRSYAWRARANSSAGTSSAYVTFGSNLPTEADFSTSATAVPTAPTKKKKHCGLTGLEGFAALGLWMALRRRNQKPVASSQ